MSDTPETDALREAIDSGGAVEAEMTSLAAKLERERDEARHDATQQTIKVSLIKSRWIAAREALQRLADCDWVITPHDRMDAVRKIARDALEASK